MPPKFDILSRKRDPIPDTADRKPSRLLTLPAELREQIFNHVIESETIMTVKSPPPYAFPGYDRHRYRIIPPWSGAIRANKQISAEIKACLIASCPTIKVYTDWCSHFPKSVQTASTNCSTKRDTGLNVWWAPDYRHGLQLERMRPSYVFQVDETGELVRHWCDNNGVWRRTWTKRFQTTKALA